MSFIIDSPRGVRPAHPVFPFATSTIAAGSCAIGTAQHVRMAHMAARSRDAGEVASKGLHRVSASFDIPSSLLSLIEKARVSSPRPAMREALAVPATWAF